MMSYGDHPRSQAQGIIVLFVMQTPIQEAGLSIIGRTLLTLFKVRAGQSGRHSKLVKYCPRG